MSDDLYEQYAKDDEYEEGGYEEVDVASTTTVKCSQCYGDVDSRATVCPHCNASMKSKNPVVFGLATLLGGFGLVVIFAGILLGFWLMGFIVGSLLLLAATVVKRF